MGKPKKLKSSIRGALEEVLSSIKASGGAPLCMQPSKTRSFRDVFTSFNSVYLVPPAAASSSSEGETRSTCGAPTSTSTCSSCLSSSSYADASPDHNVAEGAFLSVALKSERFFFSPFISRSIRGESFSEAEESLCPFQESGVEKEMAKPKSQELRKESVPIAMSSSNPYWDFRTSMEEMVAAYGLQDLPALQELLDCYLRLNEKKIHRIILLAFADLLAQLSSPSESGSLSTPPFYSPSLLIPPLYRCHAE